MFNYSDKCCYYDSLSESELQMSEWLKSFAIKIFITIVFDVCVVYLGGVLENNELLLLFWALWLSKNALSQNKKLLG